MLHCLEMRLEKVGKVQPKHLLGRIINCSVVGLKFSGDKKLRHTPGRNENRRNSVAAVVGEIDSEVDTSTSGLSSAVAQNTQHCCFHAFGILMGHFTTFTTKQFACHGSRLLVKLNSHSWEQRTLKASARLWKGFACLVSDAP